MKLIEVISLVGDGTNVRVFNSEYEEIAKYDGKESIPEELNNLEVENIFPANCGQLNIIIRR